MDRNIPFYKSLKYKITLFASIIFLIIIAFLIFSSNKNQQEMIQMKEEELNQIAVETIDRRFKVSYEILETSLAQITVSPSIIKAIDEGQVDELYRLVDQSYDKLKAAGVDEFNFYLPDDTLFLNAKNYEAGNARLPCDKTIVKDINLDSKHKPIKGVVRCRGGLFLRYIEPIYRNGKYIGSAELGMEIESRILNIFKNISSGEWYLYSLDGEEQELLQSTIDRDSYPIHIDKELAKTIDQGQVFKTEESPYIIQLIPISNYKGQYNNYFKRVFDNSELIGLQNEYTKLYILYGFLAVLIFTLLLWTVMSYLLNPLVYLEQEVRKLELGELVESIEVKTNDEIGYLAGAMENMRQSLYKREAELKKQSYIDALTGIDNRLSFDYNLEKIVKEGLFPITLIMADIDGLKKINDKFGHAAGDAHIIDSVETIKKVIRISDKLFRIGGDEFILLFPNTDRETGQLILNKVRKEIQIYNGDLKKDENPLSISFGIGVCYNESNCIDKVVSLADKRMYEDKARKKKMK